MDRPGVVDEPQERHHRALESSSRDERTTQAASTCTQRDSRRRKIKIPLSDAPEDVLESVMSWLNERDVATAMIVSSRWKRIGGSDFLWLPLYILRFGAEGDVPELLRQVKPVATGGVLPWPSPEQAASSFGRGDRLARFAFRSRLACPVVGDRVQVAWHGKFRLDACMVFIGFSWWDAKVLAVDVEDSCIARTPLDGKCGDGGGGGGTDGPGGDGVEGHGGGGRRSCAVGERRAKSFLVHYLLWGSRWDEWIEPSRIRWARSISSLETCDPTRAEPELSVDQQAELWCHGDGGGGAWLDVGVLKVSHSLVCLSDRMLNSHVRWVARDRVRPKSTAPRPIAEIVVRAYGAGDAAAGEDPGDGERDAGAQESRKRHGVCRPFPALSQISRRAEDLDRAGHRAMRKAKGGSCCTM